MGVYTSRYPALIRRAPVIIDLFSLLSYIFGALPYAGVYNSARELVEWQQAYYQLHDGRLIALPYSGVYNPNRDYVEWRQATYITKDELLIAQPWFGVYDPKREIVEWRQWSGF